MRFLKQNKLVITILLVVALVGIGVTFALSIATSKPVKNSFEAAEHSTTIEEKVEDLTKTVTVKNEKKSPAYIRVRFEVSPEDAVSSDKYTISYSGNEWVYGDDGFYYYTKPVAGYGETTSIVWKVTDDSEITVDTFDVLVYEESCVATSTSTSVTVDQMKTAFANADGAIETNQG